MQGVRSLAPGLGVAVRLSAFDSVPFQPDPERSSKGKPGPGIPETKENVLPYRWGFGVNAHHPTEADLSEPVKFLSLLEGLGIRLVNLTAGSPYYNPHIQRPALFPPSDGYLPPEDPLLNVSRQMEATRQLKQRFPNLIFVGTGIQLLAGLSAKRRAGCAARRMGRPDWTRTRDSELSGSALARLRRT